VSLKSNDIVEMEKREKIIREKIEDIEMGKRAYKGTFFYFFLK
jgi:hypothetical protein